MPVKQSLSFAKKTSWCVMGELIANQIVITVIVTVVGMCLAAVSGYVVGINKHSKARKTIDECVARNEIRQAYEDYVVKGKKLTASRYDELERLFDAYLTMGWNGSGKKWIAEIREKIPYLIID